MKGSTRYRIYLALGLYFFTPTLLLVVLLVLAAANPRRAAAMPASGPVLAAWAVVLGTISALSSGGWLGKRVPTRWVRRSSPQRP